MTQRKAQSEIVGLMIIVVLITLGMLFYLSYVTSESDSGSQKAIKKEFVDNELSASFVQSLVRVTVAECEDISLDILIKYCGLEEFDRISCTGGMTICEAVEHTMETIKNATLDEWNKAYALKINYSDVSGVEAVNFSTHGCAEGTIGRRAPGIQPIPYYPEPGTAFLELAICKK